MGGWLWPRQTVVVVPPVTSKTTPDRDGGPGGPGGEPGGGPGLQPGSGPERRPAGSNSRPPEHGASGCSTALIVFGTLIAFIMIVAIFSSARPNPGQPRGSTGITMSTMRRKPLPAGSVNETAYYTDTLGWIGNRTQLLSGLKHFYQKTGVQPYLYITDTVGGSHYPSVSELDAFARTLYDDLFTDEAHLLLVFFEYDDGYMDRYVCGTQAKTVIDTEAADILLDYLDRYYYDDSLTDERFFSQAFAEAADRIMTVTRSPWIPVFIIISIVILIFLAFVWWKRAKEQKMLEARKTEEILKTPLEQFGDTEAAKLAKKYEDPGAQHDAPDPNAPDPKP